MIQGLRSAIFKVNDLEEAKRWYTQLLGFGPYFDEPLVTTSADLSSASIPMLRA